MAPSIEDEEANHDPPPANIASNTAGINTGTLLKQSESVSVNGQLIGLIKGLVVKAGTTNASNSTTAVATQFSADLTLLPDNNRIPCAAGTLIQIPRDPETQGLLLWEKTFNLSLTWSLLQRPAVMLKVQVYVEEQTLPRSKATSSSNPNRKLLGSQVLDLAAFLLQPQQTMVSSLPIISATSASGDTVGWVLLGAVFVNSISTNGINSIRSRLEKQLSSVWNAFSARPRLSRLAVNTEHTVANPALCATLRPSDLALLGGMCDLNDVIMNINDTINVHVFR
jgi:hypothetical protein